MTVTYRGLREVGHGGDITGFNTYFARYPDAQLTVIVLSNVGMRRRGRCRRPRTWSTASPRSGWRTECRRRTRCRTSRWLLPCWTPTPGRYRLDAPEVIIQNMGSHIVITRQGDHLMAEANGMKLPLLAKSDTVFQAVGSPAELTFVCGGSDRCPRVVITLMGLREFPALRVEPIAHLQPALFGKPKGLYQAYIALIPRDLAISKRRESARSRTMSSASVVTGADVSSKPEFPVAAVPRDRRNLGLYALFFLSGFPALLYQVVWQRALFTIYGVNIESVTMVVSAFMLGLGLGSLAGGWLSERRGMPLLAVFGIAELGIGLFGIFSLTIFHYVAQYTAGTSALGNGRHHVRPVAGAHSPDGQHAADPDGTSGAHFGQRGPVGGFAVFRQYAGLGDRLFLRRRVSDGSLRRIRLGDGGRGDQRDGRVDRAGAPLHASKDAAHAVPASPVADTRMQRAAPTLAFQVAVWVAGLAGLVSLAYEILWYRVFSLACLGRAPAFAVLLGCYLTGIAFGGRVSAKLCRKMSGDGLRAASAQARPVRDRGEPAGVSGGAGAGLPLAHQSGAGFAAGHPGNDAAGRRVPADLARRGGSRCARRPRAELAIRQQYYRLHAGQPDRGLCPDGHLGHTPDRGGDCADGDRAGHGDPGGQRFGRPFADDSPGRLRRAGSAGDRQRHAVIRPHLRAPGGEGPAARFLRLSRCGGDQERRCRGDAAI